MTIKQQEANSFKNFKEAALGRLLLKRIESSITSGIADIECINRKGGTCWIEGKCIDDPPKRATTPIFKGRFERGQLAFLRERRSWKGHAFVMARIAGIYYLFEPFREIEQVTMPQIAESAVAIGKEEVISYLENLS